jgi:hypothetical protein
MRRVGAEHMPHSPSLAAARSDDAASSMLEKGKRNKNETKNIGIQGFDVILQLGVGHPNFCHATCGGGAACLIHDMSMS